MTNNTRLSGVRLWVIKSLDNYRRQHARADSLRDSFFHPSGKSEEPEKPARRTKSRAARRMAARNPSEGPVPSSP